MKNSSLKSKLISVYDFLYRKTLIPRIQRNYSLRIMSADKTIKYIRKNRCSISRYGEGEFNIMFWTSKIAFQQQDDVLANKMKDVLKNVNPNLLLCVPKAIVSHRGYKGYAKKWWKEWCLTKQKKAVCEIKALVGDNYVFGDALVTRPYMDYISRRRASRIFSELKKLWENKDILIVEGEQTRLGVGNDLFSGASSIKRILAPAVNAFACYDKILESAKRNHNGELILIALGPTATVLAADLASENCQAIDIGHIDIEYEWFLAGVKKKIAVEGKYINEVISGRTDTVCLDEKYLSEIIERIS